MNVTVFTRATVDRHMDYFPFVAFKNKYTIILQNYSNQDSTVLAQKQKYRLMEQDRKPRDKPIHIWSPYF